MRGLSPAGSAEKRRDHAGAGRYPLADKVVSRTGYGAMQLNRDGVFGPPRDRNEVIRVLNAPVAAIKGRPRTWDRLFSALQLRQLVIEPRADIADLTVDVLSLQAQLGDDLFSHMTGMIG